MKRVLRSNSTIKSLAKRLLHELEKHGYALRSTDAVSGVDITIYHSSDKLKVSNIMSGWEIECGTYETKELESEAV